MTATIWWYSNVGICKGVLTYDEAIHEEDIDGSDKLTVVCRRQRPNKRDKLVWQDNAGKWHEHMVDRTTEEHSSHHVVRVECLNSIAELAGFMAQGDKEKTNVTTHLMHLTKDTRWSVGACDNFSACEVEYFHKSVRECIMDLVNLTHGELVTDIEVGEFGVTKRTVSIVRERGTKRIVRAFTYGHNMTRATREVENDEVYTAVKGYGAKINQTKLENEIDGLQTQYNELNTKDTSGMTEEEIAEDQHTMQLITEELKRLRADLAKVQKDEYARRLECEYESNLPLDKWGIVDEYGYLAHHWYIYTCANCNDEEFLNKQIQSIANAVCRPLVRYKFEVAETDGDLWRDVQLGNRVLCIDDELGIVPNDPTLTLPGSKVQTPDVKRITHVKRRLSGRMSCVIEIGERSNPLLDQFIAAERVARATTGNGSKVVAGTPIDTGGSYLNDDNSYDPFTPTDGPFAINIITPPNKLNYVEGEPMDYSGIVVQLLNEDGSVYTSDNYPDGLAPFGELEFPVQYVSGMSGEGIATYGDESAKFTTSYSMIQYGGHSDGSQGWLNRTVDCTCPGGTYFVHNGNGLLLAVSREPSTYSFMYGDGEYRYSPEEKGTGGTVAVDQPFTNLIDGSTNYMVSCKGGDWTSGQQGWLTIMVPDLEINPLASSIVLADGVKRSYTGGKIPVNWHELSDTFDIQIIGSNRDYVDNLVSDSPDDAQYWYGDPNQAAESGTNPWT